MAKPVGATPPLPFPGRGNSFSDLSGFDSELVRALHMYLSQLAHRINESLAADGSVVMTGNLDLGGFDIINLGSVGGSPVVNMVTQVFTASGTYTPNANMIFCEVVAWGAGGGGGGAPATGAGQVSTGAGGNGGAKAQVRLTAAQIGASQTVTIGAGGTGVSGAAGNAGGNTTLGSLISAKGGEAGGASGPAPAVSAINGTPTQSATGDIRGWTFMADHVGYEFGMGPGIHGISGQNELGGGRVNTVNANGNPASANTGAGGGGTLNLASNGARTGGTGGSGFMIITEYLRP